MIIEPLTHKIGKAQVNPEASAESGIAELLNRGHQLLLELDRQHARLHDAVKDALKPDPQAWKHVKAAQTDYSAAYSELIRLSKRLNQLIQTENPELVAPGKPEKMYVFGGDGK